LYKINLTRINGNTHTVYFVGVDFISDYLVFSDIVIEHPEHGIRIVPINGYNPKYISIDDWKKAEGEHIGKLPVARVRFLLA
jgi:hypothetical protein